MGMVSVTVSGSSLPAENGKEVASPGTFSWGGIFNTYFWADPEKQIVGVLMTQLYPFDHLSIREDFKRLTYEAFAGARPPDLDRPGSGFRSHAPWRHGLLQDRDAQRVPTFTARKGPGSRASWTRTAGTGFPTVRANKAKGEYRGLPKCGHADQATSIAAMVTGSTRPRMFSRAASPCGRRPCPRSSPRPPTRRRPACGISIPTHATMTLLRIDLPTYWFLYEGYPGGKLQAAKDFVIRPDGTKQRSTSVVGGRSVGLFWDGRDSGWFRLRQSPGSRRRARPIPMSLGRSRKRRTARFRT